MLIIPDEADRLIHQNLHRLPSEPCELAEAHGRILREDITADRDLPPFDRVAMDGYALRFQELAGGRRIFTVAALQRAGMPPGSIPKAVDSCIEVKTGSAMPLGANCVAPYEETERTGDRITIICELAELRKVQALHLKGSDFKRGAAIVRSGTTLVSRKLAVAACCGKTVLRVSERPRITIVVTGAGLVDPGAALEPWQMRRNIDISLQASLRAAGFSQVGCISVDDTRAGLAGALCPAVERGDWVIATGGISGGDLGFLPGVLSDLGVKIVFHGVAQRPGKQMLFGVGPRKSPIFALPGNSTAVFICMHRYVIPSLYVASKARSIGLAKVELAGAVTFEPELDYFLPVKLDPRSAGRIAIPAPLNSSGDFTHLIGTDGFVVLPAETDALPAGTTVDFWHWV
ncbi:MAG: molybdopterin molybdotransferase MoeA [Opitutaceae bacterium]